MPKIGVWGMENATNANMLFARSKHLKYQGFVHIYLILVLINLFSLQIFSVHYIRLFIFFVKYGSFCRAVVRKSIFGNRNNYLYIGFGRQKVKALPHKQFCLSSRLSKSTWRASTGFSPTWLMLWQTVICYVFIFIFVHVSFHKHRFAWLNYHKSWPKFCIFLFCTHFGESRASLSTWNPTENWHGN